MKEPFIGPVRVEFVEAFDEPIVLPHPDGVHGGQARLLVGPAVATFEAVHVGTVRPALVVQRLLQNGQQSFAHRHIFALHFALKFQNQKVNEPVVA